MDDKKERGSGLTSHEPGNKAPEIYDELTGAYKKSLFWPRLEEELDRCIRFHIPLALVFLDIDQFKLVNDVYGHLRGDEILKECGRLLKQSLRRTDLIFRYGGDEFVIILPHTAGQEAQQVIERMITRIRHHVFEGDPPVRLSLSAGMAFFPDDGNMEQALFKVADQRLKEAKRLGGDCFVASSESTIKDGTLIQPTRLLEREEFRSLLDNFMSSFENSRSAVLEITGEWGTGKTRALQEALTLSRLRGFSVLEFQGQPDLTRISFGFIRELIHRMTEEQPNLLQALSPPLVQDVHSFLESFQQYRHTMEVSESGIFRLNQACIEMFQQLSPRGLILAIDDAHHVDDRSLEFLRSLILLSRNYPMGFIYTHPNLTLRTLSWQAPHVDYYHGHLRPLSYRGVKVLVSLWLKWDPPESFVQHLYQLSAGNPALLERLVTGLYRDGYIQRHDGEWYIRGEVESIALPTTVQAFILQRLSRLSEPAQTVAHLLSIAEGQAGLGLIRTALNLREDDIKAALEELEQAGFVWEMMEHQYRFRYELLTHTIYESLTAEERSQLHRAVALAIERTHGTMKEHTTELLAHHFLQAGDYQKSIHYYLESARASLRNHAYHEAIEYFQKALRLCEEHHVDEHVVEICYQLSHLYAITGRKDLQAIMAERALNFIQSREITTRRLEELLLLRLEALIEQPPDQRHTTTEAIQEELASLQRNARKQRYLPLRLLEARLLENTASREKAGRIYQEVLNKAEEEGNADIFYSAALRYARVLYETLRFKEAYDLLRRVLTHDFHRAPHQSGWILHELGTVEKHIHPIRTAHNHFVESYQVAYIHGLHGLAVESAFALSTLARLQGYWDTASRWAAAAREQAYKSQDVFLRANAEWCMFAAVSSAGDGSVLMQQGNRLTHYAELLRTQYQNDPRILLTIGTVHYFWQITNHQSGRPYTDELNAYLETAGISEPETVTEFERTMNLLSLLVVDPQLHTSYTFTIDELKRILGPLTGLQEHFIYPRMVLIWVVCARVRGHSYAPFLEILQQGIDRASVSGLERIQKELVVCQILAQADREARSLTRKECRTIRELVPDLSTPLQVLICHDLIQRKEAGDWANMVKDIRERTGYQWHPFGTP